jgi:ribonuclease P protein component
VPVRKLTKRSQFLAANSGVRVPMPAFVLIVRSRGDDARDAGFGITATRKLGGAVVRNRVKRRFRAIVRDVFPRNALAGADHVLIGRPDALTMDHARLTADVTKALGKAAKRLAERSKSSPLVEGDHPQDGGEAGASDRTGASTRLCPSTSFAGPPPRSGEE